MYNYEDEMELQRAIIFAGGAMSGCHNKKPVLLHSMRVAFHCMKKNYNMDLIIAAVLHDLVEDTDITIADIQSEFGGCIAHLVDLMTMDKDINDYKERYITNFQNAMMSKDALIIRCADILDNMPYISRQPDEKQEKVKSKHDYFYEKFQEILGGEPIWKEFQAAILSLKNQ